MEQPLTREQIDAIMEENLARIQALAETKVDEAVRQTLNRDTQEFLSFRKAYKIYNATNISTVLPRGTEILLDLRGGNASGTVACYKSLGDRYVEAWVKIL